MLFIWQMVDNMKTVLITEYKQIEYIYRTYMQLDFPQNELKPLSSIRKMWEHGKYDCYQFIEKETMIGYAFFVKQDAGGMYNHLFDYLAVIPECREMGYGSVFLKQLGKMIKGANCIVGEVEDPEKADDEKTRQLRQRRLQFYLRNGYIKTEVTASVFGVPFRILEIPGGIEHSDEEIKEIYSSIYRNMVPAPLFALNFKIT